MGGRARPTVVKSVDEFMTGLDHPLKSALALVRSTIQAATGIPEWLGKDRAAAWFVDWNEVKAKKVARRRGAAVDRTVVEL